MRFLPPQSTNPIEKYGLHQIATTTDTFLTKQCILTNWYSMFLLLWGGRDNLVHYYNNMFAYESLHHCRTFDCKNSNLTSCLPYNQHILHQQYQVQNMLFARIILIKETEGLSKVYLVPLPRAKETFLIPYTRRRLLSSFPSPLDIWCAFSFLGAQVQDGGIKMWQGQSMYLPRLKKYRECTKYRVFRFSYRTGSLI